MCCCKALQLFVINNKNIVFAAATASTPEEYEVEPITNRPRGYLQEVPDRDEPGLVEDEDICKSRSRWRLRQHAFAYPIYNLV